MLMHYVILDGGILFYTSIKHETATIPLYVLDVFLQILSSPFFLLSMKLLMKMMEEKTPEKY